MPPKILSLEDRALVLFAHVEWSPTHRPILIHIIPHLGTIWLDYVRSWNGKPGTKKYPLVICYIAIENGPVEIVDLSSYEMVDLSSS